MTQKGLDCLRRADCVVYDHLANDSLLLETKPDCEKIYVGKQAGNHTMPQEEINRLLAQKAQSCETVVRLKGGDVYVFGRGGEEGAWLRREGVPFVVVPGVTSAIAGLAYAGIPITHRGVARGFRVMTAHDLSLIHISIFLMLNVFIKASPLKTIAAAFGPPYLSSRPRGVLRRI